MQCDRDGKSGSQHDFAHRQNAEEEDHEHREFRGRPLIALSVMAPRLLMFCPANPF